MLPDRVSDLGPLTYESGALPIALRGPAGGGGGGGDLNCVKQKLPTDMHVPVGCTAAEFSPFSSS